MKNVLKYLLCIAIAGVISAVSASVIISFGEVTTRELSTILAIPIGFIACIIAHFWSK